MGHSLRTCLIGMELADHLSLSLQDRRDLYYAMMLKDVGCSSSSARVHELFGGDDRLAQHWLKLVDWGNTLKAARFGLKHFVPGDSLRERARRVAMLARAGSSVATELVEMRSTRGASIVRRLGLGERAAEAVRSIDEHWDGSGRPRGARGDEIPLLSRIICISQILEVFAMVHGPRGAIQLAQSKKGRWFDPALVEACDHRLEQRMALWCALNAQGLRDAVRNGEPDGASLLAGPGTLDRIALGFAEVVDAKSPFTASHSFRVTEMALKIAARLGHGTEQLIELRRAALLHDIGKLYVPNSILDKPGRLGPEEWETVRLHPYYTQRILEHIRGFENLAVIAGAHHERLDGRGYFQGLRAEQIPLGSRVIATADIYDALTTPRPYRPALPEETAVQLMERDRGIGLSGDCLDALADVLQAGEGGEYLGRVA